ncbi:hypothetical protein [Roseomonas sp. HF4]|nr:hypothetical protein [Roseomonas sp. HF4]
MSPRNTVRPRAVGEALRDLTSGALLAGGFVALCWFAGLVTIR